MIGKPKSPVETLLPLVVVLTLAASLDVSSYGLWAQQAPPKLFRPDAQKPKISDPKAVAIIDKYLEAVGGKAMLEKIKDKSTAYTNTLFQPTGEAKAEIELMMKGNYNLREQWKLNYEIQEGQPLSFVQIYNGDTEEAWDDEITRSKHITSEFTAGDIAISMRSCFLGWAWIKRCW